MHCSALRGPQSPAAVFSDEFLVVKGVTHSHGAGGAHTHDGVDGHTWMDPILADAPIEITLVGDLDVEESIAAVARTFGALPKRRDWKPYTEARTSPAPKAGFRETYEIQTQVPKSLVLMVFPTNDGIDITRRRGLNMLDQVVGDRLGGLQVQSTVEHGGADLEITQPE